MKKDTLVGIVLMIFIIVVGIFLTEERIDFDEGMIYVPVSVHLVQDGTVQFSTSRTTDEVYTIFEKANIIWAQAQIEFVVQEIDTIFVENTEFNSVIFAKNISVITERKDFDEGMINGYFARYISANGVAFSPQGVFIVADLTTVNDYRTTAHELGHLLSLHHIDGRENLMYRGSNGEILSQWEMDIVRDNAKKFYKLESN